MAEVSYLAARFNGLLDKVESAFKFQYHFIHHISHELKTPLAVMLANAERALTVNEQAVYEASLGFQKHALMELSHIINAMLEISKTEHSLLPVQADQIRVDELLFACMEELSFLHEKVQFDFRLDNTIEHADSLTVTGSTRMLKMAFMNLLKNAILYATDGRPVVELMPVGEFIQINVLNGGPLITDEDRDQLFRHFFRGENSRHVKGFGLGLVLVRRIVELHKGQLFYSTPGNSLNCFTIRLPRLS
jgi:signal transduction histidine kinase